MDLNPGREAFSACGPRKREALGIATLGAHTKCEADWPDCSWAPRMMSKREVAPVEHEHFVASSEHFSIGWCHKGWGLSQVSGAGMVGRTSGNPGQLSHVPVSPSLPVLPVKCLRCCPRMNTPRRRDVAADMIREAQPSLRCPASNELGSPD